MQTKINRILASCLANSQESINADMHLFTDLYADSLTLLEIIITIGEQLGVELNEQDIDNLTTVNSLYKSVAKKMAYAEQG
ncbi:acyl carrier protein [Serratia quinivorans]|uniref:acyl carrier protein n=1 Tax=Serratia quinivorans TaxID=137545 RepID=UPI0039822F04